MAHPDASLEAQLERLVAEQLGRRVRSVAWLEGQLGLRRFARLELDAGDPASLIARIDAAEDPAGRPPGVPPEPPLEPIRALLEANGLPVPRRFGGARTGGAAGADIDLLEDAGELSLRDVAGDPTAREALYAEACALIPRLQRIAPCDVEAFRRRLDAPLFAYKARLFATHGLSLRGRETRAAEAVAVATAFARIAELARDTPARLAHRDFQSANLHVRPERAAGERLLLIDLQGALLAPPEYDAVCLLRDSYVELSEDELAGQIERLRPTLPDAPDAESFARRFDLLTLTRKGKDLARFVYAARERGDRRFLAYVPASVRALQRAARRVVAREPGFSELAELVAELPETPCGA